MAKVPSEGPVGGGHIGWCPVGIAALGVPVEGIPGRWGRYGRARAQGVSGVGRKRRATKDGLKRVCIM